MKKVIKFIFVFLLILIGVFFVLPLFTTNKYTVERTIQLDSEKEAIASFVADFNHFDKWSPWAEIDTNMQVVIQGESGAVGSNYHWKGNEDVGEGIMTLTHKQQDTLRVNLKFVEPFESENPTYYAFHEMKNGTKVTWHMEGEMAYPWNIILLFMDMEDAIGKDFKKGLKKLKKTFDKDIQKNKNLNFSAIQETEIPKRNFIGVKDQLNFGNIQSFYAAHLPAIYSYVNKHFTLSGAPTGLYFSWDDKKGETTMAAAVPIRELDANVDTTYSSWIIGGKALKYEHYGNYDSIHLAHERLDLYLEENNLTKDSPVIEEYVTDPGQETDTTKWQTNVYYMLKK